MRRQAREVSEHREDGFDHGYEYLLTNQSRIRVKVKTRPDSRPTYVFQLECQFGEREEWITVFRLDDFHDRPHMDILHPDGRKEKQWLGDWGDNKRNMKEARHIFMERWEQERQRYEAELNG